MSYLLSVTFLTVDNVELTSKAVHMSWRPCDFHLSSVGSASLEWRSPLITEQTVYTTGSNVDDLDRNPFTASLIERRGSPLNSNFTSTLQVTASQMIMRDETTVMCLSTTANKTDNFTVASKCC